jgi:deoxyribose-phosphate aldolase
MRFGRLFLGVFPFESRWNPYLVPANMMCVMRIKNYIDHTLLRPDATSQDIQKLCEEAIYHGFYGVCVHGCHTLFARYLLRGSPVKLVTVIGFPMGAGSTEAKVCEAMDAIDNGADELDMVINLGALKAGDDAYVVQDIAKVKHAIGDHVLKVIIESGTLDPETIRRACHLIVAAGADFVKTSTGYSSPGATLGDVKQIKEAIGDALQIKASGGIRDRTTALQYIELGVSRIGTSSGILLLKTH